MQTALRSHPKYYQRVLATRATNLIAYWPCWEPIPPNSGDIPALNYLRDYTKNGFHYAGIVERPGIGDGWTSAAYSGGTDTVTDIYSTSLNSAFTPAEFTIGLWVRPTSDAFTDGFLRYVQTLAANTVTNSISIAKALAANTLVFNYTAGATAKTVTVSPFTSIDWFHLALTVSKSGDAMKAYINGAQVGTTQTGLGVWSGALNVDNCAIGGLSSSAGVSLWRGNLCHAAIWTAALTASEIAWIGRRQ